MTVPKAFGWALGEGLLLADRKSRIRVSLAFWTIAVGMRGDSPRFSPPAADSHPQAGSQDRFLRLA
jgi:hypothetical protein